MKTVIWENDKGLKAVFDNRRLFVESIDMTGTTGIHTVEILAFSDGQATISHRLGAKTIPCSFALADRRGDMWLRKNLPLFFDPATEGTLTVYSGTDEYSIRCYPQNIPVFKRDAVPYVWRFDVDFVSDFSLWQKGNTIEKKYTDIPLSNGSRILSSYCPFDIAPELYFPAATGTALFQLYRAGESSKHITISAHNYPVRIITQEYRVLNASTGENVNNILDATAQLDTLRIRFGDNVVVYSPALADQGTESGVKISYAELSAGEL